MNLSAGTEWSRWWVAGAFNYEAAAVDPRAARDPDGAAIAWEGEDGEVRRFTNAALKAEVDRAAGMLVTGGGAHLGGSAGARGDPDVRTARSGKSYDNPECQQDW